MICKNCNSPIRDGIKFCTACGSKVEKVEETSSPLAKNAEESYENEPMLVDGPVINPDDADFDKKVPLTKTVEAPSSLDLKNPAMPLPQETFGRKFLRGFLSVLCCLMIFIFTTSALSLIIARGSLAEKNVGIVLNNLDIGEIVSVDTFGETLKGVNAKNAEKLYKKTDIGVYIDDTVYDYAQYLRGGDEPAGVSADEIILILGDEYDKIFELTGRELGVRDYEIIQEYFGENGAENLGVFSEDVRTNGLLKTIRFFISIFGISLFVVLALVFVFLMTLVRKKRLDTIVWTSVPVLLSSVTIAVFGLIKPIGASLTINLGPVATAITNIVYSAILLPTLLNSFIFLLIGILLIVAYFVTKSILKNVKQKNPVKKV